MTTTPDLDTLHTYTRFASAIPPRCIYVNANGDGADPDAYGHHCPYGKWPMFLRFFFQYSFSKFEYEKEIAADPARWRYVVFACLDGHGWLVLEKADTDDSEAPTTLTATGREMAGRAGRPVQMIPEMEHAHDVVRTELQDGNFPALDRWNEEQEGKRTQKLTDDTLPPH